MASFKYYTISIYPSKKVNESVSLGTTEPAKHHCSSAVLASSKLLVVQFNVRRGIGFVPQGHNVFKELSVAQNLSIAGLMHDPAHVSEVYQLFPILKERQDQRAGALSGGQQQMLALGMAMMGKPKLLLLDEPTTGLAPIIVRDMFEAINLSSQTQGTTLLIVEQNVQATLDHVDRAIVVKQGRVIFDDSSDHLREQKSLWHLF